MRAKRHRTLAEIVGPWTDPGFESGLIKRCRNAWNKSIEDLSREELATCLRQKIAISHLLPIARQRIRDGIDDGTEMHEGELAAAITEAEDSS